MVLTVSTREDRICVAPTKVPKARRRQRYHNPQSMLYKVWRVKMETTKRLREVRLSRHDNRSPEVHQAPQESGITIPTDVGRSEVLAPQNSQDEVSIESFIHTWYIYRTSNCLSDRQTRTLVATQIPNSFKYWILRSGLRLSRLQWRM